MAEYSLIKQKFTIIGAMEFGIIYFYWIFLLKCTYFFALGIVKCTQVSRSSNAFTVLVSARPSKFLAAFRNHVRIFSWIIDLLAFIFILYGQKNKIKAGNGIFLVLYWNLKMLE